MTTETDLLPLLSAKGLAMRMIVWMFGEPSFYVAQHHGGGTARHGPYPLAKAKEECERFRRSGFSSWIENKNGPRFRSPHQPDFRPVDCRINLAMRSDQFALAAYLGDIHQIADAALSKENRND